MEELPTPTEIIAQYEAGEIDLETLALQTMRYVAILDQIKEIELIVSNGLLQDVKMITDTFNLERPSAPGRERLKAWIRQTSAEAAPAAADVPTPDEAAKGVDEGGAGSPAEP